MFARTRVIGHYEINYYDPGNVATVTVSTRTDGDFDAGTVEFDKLAEDLKANGYALTGEKALLQGGGHTFIVHVALKVAPVMDTSLNEELASLEKQFDKETRAVVFA